MKKKAKDEIAPAAAETAEEEIVVYDEAAEKRPQRQSLLKTLTGAVDTAKQISGTVDEIYRDWIKPIRDNWSQIKRRMSVITTVISIIFFIMYVPFLLFNKISKGLALGWDIALYVCIGVYIVTVVALLIVTLASGKSESVAMEKKRKKISKIILFIVRIASLTIGIAALIISAMSGTSDTSSAVTDTIAIVFAVFSIIFTAFPLLFGGIGGFAKWLISPAKMKFKFSFVALEWYQAYTSEQLLDKNAKRFAKKYGERMGKCLDRYFLPQIGKKYIKSVDAHMLVKVLEGVSAEDINLCEWMIKAIFDYAEECGYVDVNPCEEITLEGDILREGKLQKQLSAAEKPASVVEKLFSVFGRKSE